MKAKDLRERFAAERIGERPVLTNYAKWLEEKFTQQSTPSHDKVMEVEIAFKYYQLGANDEANEIYNAMNPENSFNRHLPPTLEKI